MTPEQMELLVYGLWALTVLGSLFLPTMYTPAIIGVVAVYFAEEIKKKDIGKGNMLIIGSVIAIVVGEALVLDLWSAFLSAILP